MDRMIDALKKQYLSALDALEKSVGSCPDDLWEKPSTTAPFWREAYHCLFWMHNFVGDRTKSLNYEPFGASVDPRLFSPITGTATKSEIIEYSGAVREYISQAFSLISREELDAEDTFEDGEFATVFERILYGLSHAQYHAGRLSAAVRLHTGSPS